MISSSLIESGVLIAIGFLLLVVAWLQYYADPYSIAGERIRCFLRIIAFALMLIASIFIQFDALPHWNFFATGSIVLNGAALVYHIHTYPDDNEKGDRV